MLCASLGVGVGCSGGGGSSTPAPGTPTGNASSTPIPTKSINPSAAPTGAGTPVAIVTASPTPVPTAPPSAPANASAVRPLHNGDAYKYAGTTLQTFVYNGAAPSPSASTTYAVTQDVAVTNNQSYNQTTGLYDFKTSETDTSPLQSTSITTDTFYGTVPGGTSGGTALVNYGYTSNDSRGEKLTVTFTNPGLTNGLVDVVPEISGAAWSNTGAQKIVQSEADGFSATRTYAADGSYVDNATYPQAGAVQPGAQPLTATITANADGSATYSLPLVGPPNVTVSYSAPASNGAIAIGITQPGPTAMSSPGLVQSATVGAWYQQPVKLYQELDRDNGAVAIPAACNVPASSGTTANQIEQKSVRVDPVLGTLETFDQLTYVGITGVVCVTLSDRTLTYYDYSGQGNGSPTGISYAGGNLPLETATLTTTIGLVAATIQPMSVGRQSVEASGMRLANARANFVSLVERHRAAAQRRAFHHLRTSLLERTTR
ncbi:MAG: hypothetical protein NVS1B2_12760 [Vulcanimicrobiaceae bacterium]